jgi:exodeoxyribonuclease-3
MPLPGAGAARPFPCKLAMPVKIATWNVNSIKARLDHVLKWLQTESPDVLFLQELKGEEFPTAPFQDAGYESLFVSQKAYNGVAILSRGKAAPILTALAGDDTDAQARYIEADWQGVRLVNIYLPNGNPVGDKKFAYKLNWMDRLIQRLSKLRQDRIPFLVGGDFNVIPDPKDCYDPALWAGDALFHTDTRRKFRTLLSLGLTDALRVATDAPQEYTFWDYQAGAWQRNNGIRIDHFLLSPPVSDRLVSCRIDRTPRGWDKPSDHTPVILELSE